MKVLLRRHISALWQKGATAVTYEEARVRAQQYLDQEPIEHPDYRWRLAEGVLQSDGWYFDYKFEAVRPIPESEWEQFGGAPGFIVASNGSDVRDISWDDYADRKLRQAETIG